MTHKFLLLLNDIMAEECRVFLLFHHFLTLQFEEQKIKLNPFFFLRAEWQVACNCPEIKDQSCSSP